MIPKQDVARLLEKHLGKNCLQETVDKIAQEIVDLELEWEELPFSEEEMGYTMKVDCQDICFLAEQIQKGAIVRLFRKRENSDPPEDKYSKYVLKGE